MNASTLLILTALVLGSRQRPGVMNNACKSNHHLGVHQVSAFGMTGEHLVRPAVPVCQFGIDGHFGSLASLQSELAMSARFFPESKIRQCNRQVH
jgi:hypothetical protein